MREAIAVSSRARSSSGRRLAAVHFLSQALATARFFHKPALWVSFSVFRIVCIDFESAALDECTAVAIASYRRKRVTCIRWSATPSHKI